MDRVTQLQDAIDQIATMFFSSIGYVTRKSNFEQVNPDMPITQVNPEAEPADKFNQSKKELAQDICIKAKQIRMLIDALPGLTVTDEEQIAQLERLEEDVQIANKEHAEVQEEARALLVQVKAILEAMSEDAQQVYD